MHSNVQLTASWFSSKFSKFIANKQVAAGAYFCQRFCRPTSLLSRSNVSSCCLLPLHVGKPLFTDGSIVPCPTRVRFSLARFVSPLLSCMKQVPFESTGIRLQNMQKLSVYTGNSPRYTLWYADRKIKETSIHHVVEKMSLNEASVSKSVCSGNTKLLFVSRASERQT